MLQWQSSRGDVVVVARLGTNTASRNQFGWWGRQGSSFGGAMVPTIRELPPGERDKAPGSETELRAVAEDFSGFRNQDGRFASLGNREEGVSGDWKNTKPINNKNKDRNRIGTVRSGRRRSRGPARRPSFGCDCRGSLAMHREDETPSAGTNRNIVPNIVSSLSSVVQ